MNRRTFLKNGLWLLGASTILRAGVLPSSRKIATPMASATAYTAYASAFDGTNDWMTHAGDLTGAADGKKGTISAWLKLTGGDGSILTLFEQSSGRMSTYRDTTNYLQTYWSDTSGNLKLKLKTAVTATADGLWHHYLFCWDVGTVGARHVYVDGTEQTTATTFVDATLDYTSNGWWFGAENGNIKLNSEVCEFWFGLDYINDPTKFRNAATGKPISLGATGSLPGVTPLIYFPNPYATFQNDASGRANNFTVTGALTQGTPP